MAGSGSDTEDAITQGEIQGAAPAPTPLRNAFTELMTRKRKPESTPPEPSRASRNKPYRSRDGLGAYLDNPSSFPASRVIFHNEDFVAINDLYPKASIHTLLLPRSPAHNLLHPFEAFDDIEFLASVQKEVLRLKDLVAKELQRRFSKYSKAEAAREAVLEGLVEPGKNGELPKGRDWHTEIITGIHAHPSMNHLHVHVLSRDMYSECMKHRKHYNSFNTPFLIDVADFPLAPDDPRRHPGREGYLMKKDLICWRCGQNFKNQFAKLKEHLAEEFAEWKKE
ncbi:Aprataxin-like protein [Colletotrichum chlorophyti]|uniref:Aprataxin-like protein n=1 Tax=Colletotrichum chlorophyti TaxID=708187 RepID=A0A1Q8S236_9PEZI|nr:Aprataxin-like protein [Colletotrichum chlorophyti]